MTVPTAGVHEPLTTPRPPAAAATTPPDPTGRPPAPDAQPNGTAPHTPSGRPSLSPSRAADFKTCPLLYRYRCVDRLPERPTSDQARGTLVHAVLERLFDLPAHERTLSRATDLVEPEWARLTDLEPALATLFEPAPPAADPEAGPAATHPDATHPDATHPDAASPDGVMPDAVIPDAGRSGTGPAERAAFVDRDEFLASARDLLGGYFAVEDPRRLAPAEREYLVSTEIDEGRLLLRGYVDRLDVSPAGDLRVVDYKTGGAPREAFEARALFQLKFYALVLWRTRGVVPRALRLLYLKDAEICDYHPDTEELVRFERTLIALWAAIARATAERDFRPKPSRLCGWCAHQALCPAFGGTPPPYPDGVPVAVTVAPDGEVVDLDG